MGIAQALSNRLWATVATPYAVYTFRTGTVPVDLGDLISLTNTPEFLATHRLIGCAWIRAAATRPDSEDLLAFVSRLEEEKADAARVARRSQGAEAFYRSVSAQIQAGRTFCADAPDHVPAESILALAREKAPAFTVTAHTDYGQETGGTPPVAILFRATHELPATMNIMRDLSKRLRETKDMLYDVYTFSATQYGLLPADLSELTIKTNTPEFLDPRQIFRCTWARTAAVRSGIQAFPDELRVFVTRADPDASPHEVAGRAASAFYDSIEAQIQAGRTFCVYAPARVPEGSIAMLAPHRAPAFNISVHADYSKETPGPPRAILLFRAAV
jgi:hypothetical protein